MKDLVFYFLLALASFGCASQKLAEQKLSFDFKSGLNGIHRGDNAQKIIDLLGQPDSINRKWEQQDGTIYYNYSDQGLQFSVKEQKVRTTFLFFIARQFKPYRQKIELINPAMKEDDIIRLFGKPEKRGASTVSSFGEFPGAKEVYLFYKKRGVIFTFYDGKLADVRFFKMR